MNSTLNGLKVASLATNYPKQGHYWTHVTKQGPKITEESIANRTSDTKKRPKITEDCKELQDFSDVSNSEHDHDCITDNSKCSFLNNNYY